MTDDMLSLQDIVGDLVAILELVRQGQESGAPTSYDTIQTNLADQLHLHILSYIRFLEGRDELIYDRVSDQLTVPDGGLEVLDNPDVWQEPVAEAFADHIADTERVEPDSSEPDSSEPDSSDPELSGQESWADDIDDAQADIDPAAVADGLDIDQLAAEPGQDMAEDVAGGQYPGAIDPSAGTDLGDPAVNEPIEQSVDELVGQLGGQSPGVAIGAERSGGDATAAAANPDNADPVSPDNADPVSADPDNAGPDNADPVNLDGRAPSAGAPDARSAGDAAFDVSSDAQSTPHRDNMNAQTHTHGQSEAGQSASSAPSTADLYQRGDELGSGGVGTVYQANQTKLDRRVALKEINQVFNVFAGVQRDDIIASLTAVTQEQANLVHPNIVQVLDIETTTEYPFVVTQFAPCGNLRRLIDMEGRPALSVALKYFMQILSALSTAHDAQVVHGNLKPENVVLDAAGNAMLSDFGLSSIVERDDSASSHVYVGVGTVAYMSPEQFQDPNAATVRSDIYSLGIMFYEMLTGKVPGRRSPMPSSFYPDIPRKLDDIFDKMSTDAQDDRYRDIDAILHDLYGADDVMSLLDNRSGVLFMRDPIEYGELGGVAAPAQGDGLSESSVSEASFEAGLDDASAAELSELSEVSHASEFSEAGDDEDGDDDADPDELGTDASDPQAVGDDDADPDEVLDKLDKYGDMFEEEQA